MLNPAPGKIVVRRQTAPKQTPGGVLLPEKRDQRSVTARIIAVGHPPEKWNGPEPKAGDLVVLPAYSGTEIEHKGETLHVISYEEILATVK